MNDIRRLQDLIHDDALINPCISQYSNGKQTIVLTEGSLYSVTIRNIPIDTIAFKADSLDLRNFFKGNKGERKRADFVIVANQDNGSCYIIYIEMKSAKGPSDKIIQQQLRGAKCIVDYCRSIVQEFWEDPKFLDKHYNHRFVSIKDISINKRPTRQRRTCVHNKPEDMLKLFSPKNNSIYFNELL